MVVIVMMAVMDSSNIYDFGQLTRFNAALTKPNLSNLLAVHCGSTSSLVKTYLSDISTTLMLI